MEAQGDHLSKLLESEAGLVLLAELFGIMGQKSALRIIMRLAYGAPLHKSEVVKSSLDRKILTFLIDEGHVLKIKAKRDGEKVWGKHYLFLADEHMRCTVEEVVHLLQRMHQERAIAFSRLEKDLSMGSWNA
jgi:hypothetical protein